MTEIFLHQLRDHLRSLRFQLSLLLLLLFFVANGAVYSWKGARLVDEVGMIEATNADRYRQIDNVPQLADSWFRVQHKLLGTEFIAESGSDWLFDAAWVGTASGSASMLGRAVATNYFMERFKTVDWVLIVNFVVSFLCIALAYDTVAGQAWLLVVFAVFALGAWLLHSYGHLEMPERFRARGRTTP